MRFYNQTHRYYCGVDLHARSMFVHVLDHEGQTRFEQDLPAGPAPAVYCGDRFGVVVEPVLETCRAKARVIAGGEALIVHRNAVVERLGIGDYRPCFPGCVQELPHQLRDAGQL